MATCRLWQVVAYGKLSLMASCRFTSETALFSSETALFSSETALFSSETALIFSVLNSADSEKIRADVYYVL